MRVDILCRFQRIIQLHLHVEVRCRCQVRLIFESSAARQIVKLAHTAIPGTKPLTSFSHPPPLMLRSSPADNDLASILATQILRHAGFFPLISD